MRLVHFGTPYGVTYEDRDEDRTVDREDGGDAAAPAPAS
jgi:hypothetical protein